MKLLKLTLDSAAANVALDEALLEEAEHGRAKGELLRLWQPAETVAVLGRSSPAATEVNMELCRQDGIPVIRRCSGGATILTAPGCLMYAVVLGYESNPQLRMLDFAHRFVMQKIQQAILNRGVETGFQGTCDLTIDNRKVSGNALRCKKNYLVYHGTLICDEFDLELIPKYLGTPKRQPDYRRQRQHQDFLTRIPVSTTELSNALQETWNCDETISDWPQDAVEKLVTEKYGLHEWNFKI